MPYFKLQKWYFNNICFKKYGLTILQTNFVDMEFSEASLTLAKDLLDSVRIFCMDCSKFIKIHAGSSNIDYSLLFGVIPFIEMMCGICLKLIPILKICFARRSLGKPSVM